MTICKPRNESLSGTKLAGTLILDFCPPEWWENKFLLFKPPSLWHFVMATGANIARSEDWSEHSVNGCWINQIRWDLGSRALENINRICIFTPQPSKISTHTTMENGTGTCFHVQHPRSRVGGIPPHQEVRGTSSLMPSDASSTCQHLRKASGWSEAVPPHSN